MAQHAVRSRPGIWTGVGVFVLVHFLVIAVVPIAVAQGTQGGGDDALALFEQVYRFVERNYVDEVDPDLLIEGALQGLFESLGDPHSAYLTEDEMRGLTDTTSGEFGGVGMYINKPRRSDGVPEYIEIVSPIEDTPAYRAGLRSGDRIMTVDGVLTADLSVDEVVDLLRGPPGSDVRVMILRGENLEFPVTLERALIQVPTVKWDMIHGDIGFLRIIQFTPFTDDLVREAVEDFKRAGYTSMIIDLRSNPGGLLSGVVDVAGVFFDGGLVVETRGRIPGENQRFTADRGVLVEDDIEIVVLIDDGSASAAEILAAALKDRDRAVLLGETTYGKGSVQQVRTLGDAGFRLTMSRYYTPAGTNIDHIGVTPDIEYIEPDLTEEEQQAYARIREEERIRGFVAESGESAERDIDAFIAGLREDGIVLNERWIRRLVRIEVNRVMNRTEVYDLDYDLMLQRAVALLEE